ncbi:unnamed protein product [Paramecium primaurelia]|uniref:Uncharacterized protein n=1 Tax=Paramecium primaurelia TaxID=5886 RepID=A0A8S1NJH6_PARPR|nr:unnamed protein product [Paramecium primaurelia]
MDKQSIQDLIFMNKTQSEPSSIGCHLYRKIKNLPKHPKHPTPQGSSPRRQKPFHTLALLLCQSIDIPKLTKKKNLNHPTPQGSKPFHHLPYHSAKGKTAIFWMTKIAQQIIIRNEVHCKKMQYPPTLFFSESRIEKVFCEKLRIQLIGYK